MTKKKCLNFTIAQNIRKYFYTPDPIIPNSSYDFLEYLTNQNNSSLIFFVRTSYWVGSLSLNNCENVYKLKWEFVAGSVEQFKIPKSLICEIISECEFINWLHFNNATRAKVDGTPQFFPSQSSNKHLYTYFNWGAYI